MNKSEIEQALLESLGHIKTWEDMYEWFDTQVRLSVRTGHPAITFGALFFMQSFLQAMRELPSEGDIRVLMKRMVAVLVWDTQEKFSVNVEVLLDSQPSYTPEDESAAQETYQTLMQSVMKQKKE